MIGRESISQPFSFAVELVSLSADDPDLDELPGAEASLVFERDDEALRTVHGMIAEVDDLLSTETEFRALRITLVPRIHRLRLVEMQEVFLGLSVPDILRTKLEMVGLGASDVEMRLRESYEPREFVVQYGETDLAFLSRLTEHIGVSWFIEEVDGVDRIVFTDHAGGFRPVEGHEQASFRPRGETLDVYRLERKTRLMPKTWMVQDYNHRTPTLDLTSSHTSKAGLAGGVVEFGTHARTPPEALSLARVRAEEREAATRYFTGESSLSSFTAGARVTLEGHAKLPAQDLLLVEVEHSLRQSTMMHGGGGDADASGHGYRNTFRAVDGAKTYRPPRVTPKPRIHGVLSGVVEPRPGGEIGDHAEIDDDGRYTIRFHFDAGPRRPKSSLPVRMIQPLAGPAYGVHFPLRPGVEVLVTFVDGDPDRPVISGAVPNPVIPSPVTRKNALQSRIQTHSGMAIILKDR